MTDEWPCANFTEPVTCLSAGVTVTGRCGHCQAVAERGRAEKFRRERDEASRAWRGATASAVELNRAVEAVRKLHQPIPIYPGDCESPDDDHDFDPAEEFCRDCPPMFDACGHCRDEDGSWVEWPCETAMEVDPNRWVDEIVRAVLGKETVQASRLSVRINDDCAAYLNSRLAKGESATEIVREALSLHKFIADGGAVVAPTT